MSIQLTFVFLTTPVILSCTIPHSYQHEQHPEVIKQCGNIVAFDGIQIFIYMPLIISVILGASVVISTLTLNLLMTTIVAPPSNASKWQMGFNLAFKGLNQTHFKLSAL